MRIVTEFGPAALGLNARITIYNADTGGIEVNSASMTSLGSGAYTYLFSGHQMGVNYYVVCDGGSTLSGDDRYTSDVIPATW
jgi:hypothetical protein